MMLMFKLPKDHSYSLCFVLLALLLATPASGQSPVTIIETTNGVVTNFDTPRLEASPEFVAMRNRTDTEAVILQLTKDRDINPAPYLFELARRLLPTDSKLAVQWYMIGMTRLLYDGLRCSDRSVYADGGFLGHWVRQYPEVAQQITGDRPDIAALQTNVRQRPDLFAGSSDIWYVCSHGMVAISAGMSGKAIAEVDYLRPRKQWPALQTYLRGQGSRPGYLDNK